MQKVAFEESASPFGAVLLDVPESEPDPQAERETERAMTPATAKRDVRMFFTTFIGMIAERQRVVTARWARACWWVWMRAPSTQVSRTWMAEIWSEATR